MSMANGSDPAAGVNRTLDRTREDILMKMDTPNVTIILTVSFVITMITVAGIMGPPTTAADPAPPIASVPLPAPSGVAPTPVESAIPAGPPAVAIASVPAMEEIRELPTITPGAALDVISLMAGRIQILDDKDQILAEMTGQTPRIRCHAAASQTLYKVRFQPADGRLGIQRVFPLTLGQTNAYVRIVASPSSPAKILLKQKTMPFDF